MKNFTYLLGLMILSCSTIMSQHWTDNLDQQKLQNDKLTLQEYQKAFNDYWEPYDVKNGYYEVNGERMKAPGWKQFKRWEWKAEYLVNGEGNFATTSTPEEMDKYFLKYPDAVKSTSGNWTNIGYNTTNGGYQGIGRVNCIAFHPTNTNTMWIGAPSGGLWKTTDGGSNWSVLTDNNTVLGVSAIAVTSNYATSNTIYIGTGDRDGGSVWSLGGGNTHDNEGVGVLKSTDGGATWTSSLSFTPSQKIVVYDLLINPTNDNNLIAATGNGIYETTNAGTSWTQFTTNVCTDLEYRPGSSSVFYGAYTNGKYILTFTKSGTWSWSTYTLPGSASYRTELAVSANNSSIVYALTVNSGRGLEAIYKSTNSGVSYTVILNGSTSGNNLLGYQCDGSTTTGQGTYDVFITANPSNANDIYVGGINVWRSTNGGSNWSIKSIWSSGNYPTCGVNEVHADQHCCEFHPITGDVYIGHDGGIYYSTDNGTNWTDLSNTLTINQIYRIGQAAQSANDIIIGLQDNGTHLYSGGSWIMDGVMGGDGMECLIDPSDLNTQYGEFPNGALRRTTDKWSTNTSITSGLSGSGAWVTPFVLDPNNSNTIYVGYQDVFKSTDQGTNWIKLSNWGGSTLRSLSVAPSNSSYIYAATQTVLYKTTDGGTTWTNITTGLPVTNGNITYIAVKNSDPNTVWITIGGFNSDAVYQTTNGGTTWTNISTGLPQLPAMSVVQNKLNTSKDELYVAMTQGVWVKYGTANWTAFKSGLPNVMCTEMDIYYDSNTPSNSRLRVGTFGRGLWESPLPVVDFTANNTLPSNTMTTVTFTDLSTNSPTGWAWSFSPNTVTYVGSTNSFSQNPQVVFNNPGAYSVTLSTSNAFGIDSRTKSTYIHVGTPGLWAGTTDGAWNTTTNWENHLVPDATTGVTINPGSMNWPVYSGNFSVGTDCGTLLLNGNAEFDVTGDFTIPSGKTVTCNSNATLKVAGDFNNFGTFTPGNSVVEMNGGTNTTISGNLAATGNLNTLFANGGYTYGGYIDVTASGGKSITVNSFDINCTTTGTVNAEIWYKSGSYSGFTSNPGAWTQLGTTQAITGAGWTNNTNINPGASITIPAGLTYSFFINCYSGGTDYGVCSTGSNNYSNSEITIITGVMSYATAVGSGGWNGYTLNCSVNYSFISNSNPISFYNLDINKSNAVVTTDANLTINNHLIVQNAAMFTNATGNSLNVMGNMTLKADATGMASYLDNGTTTISGSADVEEYITSEKWHLVSPPVSGATINTYYDIYLKQYNEPTDTWTYLVTPNSTPMNQAQGYSAWASDTYTGTTTVTFNGSLTNTDIPVSSLSYTSAATKAGFNLLGNPYPCALDWNSNWSTSNLSGWMVIYDNGTHRGWHPTSGSYNGKTNGVIPSTQGFWVRALNSSGSLTIPASERLHSSQAFYKEAIEDIHPTIRLKSEINDMTDETVVSFHPECTAGFDGYYDLTKFTNVDEAPMLFSISENENYGVNFYEENYINKVIPIGFKTGEEGLYCVAATEISNFDDYISVFLEDIKTGTITNLNQSPEYNFSYSSLDEDHRFNLHFKDSWNDAEDQNVIGINIYSYNQTVYVQLLNQVKGQIEIFDILGQKLARIAIEEDKLVEIPIDAGTGYYLVRVETGSELVTKKVFVK